MHVGFLGLGAIGAPMVAPLARHGHPKGWSRSASRAAELTGGETADDRDPIRLTEPEAGVEIRG